MLTKTQLQDECDEAYLVEFWHCARLRMPQSKCEENAKHAAELHRQCRRECTRGLRWRREPVDLTEQQKRVREAAKAAACAFHGISVEDFGGYRNKAARCFAVVVLWSAYSTALAAQCLGWTALTCDTMRAWYRHANPEGHAKALALAATLSKEEQS